MTGNLTMLKGFLRKLTGTIRTEDAKTVILNSAVDITKSCEEYVLSRHDLSLSNTTMPTIASALSRLSPLLGGLDNLKSKSAQALHLRSNALQCLDEMAGATYFLLPDNEVGDLAIAARKHESLNSVSVHDIPVHCTNRYLENVIDFYCIRKVSESAFNDASENDYAKLYLSIVEQICKHENNLEVADAKDESYLFEMFLPHLHQQHNETKEHILSGSNYNSTGLELGDKSEEEVGEEEEKHQKVAKIVDDAYASLLGILTNRADQLRRGELYNVDGYPPTDYGSAFRFETGLMLIAMVNNVEDRDECISVVKQLIRDYLRNMEGLSDESLEELEKEDLPLGEQLQYLECYEDAEEEGGWFANVLLIGTMMLFNIGADEYEMMDTNEKQTIGEMSVRVGKDAWKIYAMTCNVFGRDMSEEWFLDD